ncbi:UNVERIFIED_ORG: LPS-assembly lipoprotein [Zoogloea ramigera]|uniref:LPS-assembly lipoprotein LptE n=1 Tax=Duganella zoogloeoides TaxID=75659 RepID=A0ABZ0XYS2_9BURK|nr:LPS assembly lipoprotein LptE [Duganella zoogloeoides]WQH04890.1 LPS assembly lipoprotein LptE [Duganella zoogloeoides]
MTTTSGLFRRTRAAGMALLLTATLSACGFHLRGDGGHYTLPFPTMYIGLPESSPLAIDLKRNIRVNGNTTVVNSPKDADGVVEVLSNPETTKTKTILSLNSNGRVRQYLLQYTIVFRVLDRQGNELLGPTTISLSRPIDFNETQLLAKEQEEALLYKDMQTDLVQQMMRRMAAVKTTRMSVPGPGPAPQDPSAAPAVPIL